MRAEDEAIWDANVRTEARLNQLAPKLSVKVHLLKLVVFGLQLKVGRVCRERPNVE